jgi:hypothetical protein
MPDHRKSDIALNEFVIAAQRGIAMDKDLCVF